MYRCGSSAGLPHACAWETLIGIRILITRCSLAAVAWATVALLGMHSPVNMVRVAIRLENDERGAGSYCHEARSECDAVVGEGCVGAERRFQHLVIFLEVCGRGPPLQHAHLRADVQVALRIDDWDRHAVWKACGAGTHRTAYISALLVAG